MEFKKFFRSLFWVFLLAFVVWSPLLYFNIIVDPYGVFFNGKNFDWGTVNKRYVKARYVTKHPDKYDSFIFGSSRINFFHPDRMPDGKYYNMSYSGGLPYEHLQDVRYFLDNGITVKNIIIGIDFFSLLHNQVHPDLRLHCRKYPETPAEMIDFYSTYIFNKPDLEFLDKVKWMRTRNRVADMKQGIFYGDEDEQINENVTKHHQKTIFRVPYQTFTYTSDFERNLEPIAELAALAKQNDISLTFFINPIYHLTYLTVDFPEYFQALRMLAKITDFYDFGGLNAITENNYFYYENSHYTKATADLIIDRLHDGNEAPEIFDFGEYVTRENINEHIELLQMQLVDYFAAADLNNEYIPPTTVKQNENHEIACNAKIRYINGHQQSNDTIIVSSNTLYLQGYLDCDKAMADIYVKAGEKRFAVSPAGRNINNGKPENTWISKIPVRHLGQGVHQVEIVANGEETSHHSNTQFIKVVGPQRNFPDLNQTARAGINTPIPLLNDYSISSKVYIPAADNDIFYIEARVNEKFIRTAANGIIAAVEDNWYLSQFIFDEAPPSYYRPGVWGVKVPTWMLQEGENKIDLYILNEQNDSISKTSNDLRILKYDDAGIDYLRGLEKSSDETLYNLDIVNGNLFSRQSTEPISTYGRYITFAGWAVDKSAAEAASGVVVVIDGKQFLSDYGAARPDVAQFFNNENYQNSGWSIAISRLFFARGVHKVELFVISGDGKKYYPITQNVKINL